jgi:hypothetical protein
MSKKRFRTAWALSLAILGTLAWIALWYSLTARAGIYEQGTIIVPLSTAGMDGGAPLQQSEPVPVQL